MQLIGAGGALILVISSDLGYGDRGSPPTIPGGATLVFYVETLAIND
jgi:FKBP-type peptidyl-prolyl cis-trans isomerase